MAREKVRIKPKSEFNIEFIRSMFPKDAHGKVEELLKPSLPREFWERCVKYLELIQSSKEKFEDLFVKHGCIEDTPSIPKIGRRNGPLSEISEMIDVLKQKMNDSYDEDGIPDADVIPNGTAVDNEQEDVQDLSLSLHQLSVGEDDEPEEEEEEEIEQVEKKEERTTRRGRSIVNARALLANPPIFEEDSEEDEEDEEIEEHEEHEEMEDKQRDEEEIEESEEMEDKQRNVEELEIEEVKDKQTEIVREEMERAEEVEHSQREVKEADSEEEDTTDEQSSRRTLLPTSHLNPFNGSQYDEMNTDDENDKGDGKVEEKKETNKEEEEMDKEEMDKGEEGMEKDNGGMRDAETETDDEDVVPEIVESVSVPTVPTFSRITRASSRLFQNQQPNNHGMKRLAVSEATKTTTSSIPPHPNNRNRINSTTVNSGTVNLFKTITCATATAKMDAAEKKKNDAIFQRSEKARLQREARQQAVAHKRKESEREEAEKLRQQKEKDILRKAYQKREAEGRGRPPRRPLLSRPGTPSQLNAIVRQPDVTKSPVRKGQPDRDLPTVTESPSSIPLKKAMVEDGKDRTKSVATMKVPKSVGDPKRKAHQKSGKEEKKNTDTNDLVLSDLEEGNDDVFLSGDEEKKDTTHTLSRPRILRPRSKSSKSSTGRRKAPTPPRNDDYGMDDLNSGDETDDDEAPRKMIPLWAQGQALEDVCDAQFNTDYDVDEYFGSCIEENVDLKKMFKGRRVYRPRTSSANWGSCDRSPPPVVTQCDRPIPLRKSTRIRIQSKSVQM